MACLTNTEPELPPFVSSPFVDSRLWKVFSRSSPRFGTLFLHILSGIYYYQILLFMDAWSRREWETPTLLTLFSRIRLRFGTCSRAFLLQSQLIPFFAFLSRPSIFVAQDVGFEFETYRRPSTFWRRTSREPSRSTRVSKNITFSPLQPSTNLEMISLNWLFILPNRTFYLLPSHPFAQLSRS